MSDPEDLSEETTDTTRDTEPSGSDLSEQRFPSKIYGFLRSAFEEPKHIVLSSPFARRIGVAASGPSKPPWYCAPIASQFLQFKALVHMVEDATKAPMPFMPFVELLQELAPTVTPEEVLRILQKLARDNLEEIDFGEFIFLLSNNPIYDKILEGPRYKRYTSKHYFNPRQRILFSALGFYCLIQTEDDIARVYRGKKAPHAEVISYHMDAARNLGLSELQMEKRQKAVRQIARRFKKRYTSAYTVPVPFVRATIHEPYYQNYLKRKRRLSKSLYPPDLKKMTYHRKIRPIEPKRALGTRVVYETEEEYILHLYLMASIPRPDMKVPADRLKEMRTRVFISDTQYLKDLKEEALKDYYERLHQAIVLYGKDTLKKELKKGFPTDVDKIVYYDLYKMYMPLSTKCTYIDHPWTPVNIGAKYKRRPKTPPPFGRSGR